MIRLRALQASLAAGVLFSAGLSACVTKAPLSASASPEDIAFAGAPAETYPANTWPGQCYWLSDTGEGWLARADLPGPDYCHELDSCAGGAGLSGGGCYKWADGPHAPAKPWAEFGLPVMSQPESEPEPENETETSGPACYWQSGPEDGYGSAYKYWNETACFRFSACTRDSDLGDDTATCFKWAMGPDAPALPWSERLTNAALAASILPPEDIYEGAFEMTSDSCFEDCQPVPMRTISETPLHLHPDATSPVIGNIPAGECVGNKNYKLLSTPHRGVVLETDDGFVAGDVIYYLAYDGEGNYRAWWRGDYTYAYEGIPPVRWDPEPETLDPRVGYWLELERADGTSGWAKAPPYDLHDALPEPCPPLGG
ncbi:hypothetical protein [Hyphomonas sp.]|uniref:hypothetical protein n=1 Tax=Hyphomonas sp. TaxID=87 RepID=UPI0025BC7108|nr:hypothetical protein [Hyphomonas sp.]